jgi:hypothetical protein
MVRCNRYSVPARFIGHRLRAKLSASAVTVYDRNSVVARHQRGKPFLVSDAQRFHGVGTASWLVSGLFEFVGNRQTKQVQQGCEFHIQL